MLVLLVAPHELDAMGGAGSEMLVSSSPGGPVEVLASRWHRRAAVLNGLLLDKSGQLTGRRCVCA